VKQATKEVASAHPGSPSLADQGQTDRWTRQFQPKRSVWTMSVVVLDIHPENLLQMTTAEDQQPVEALGPDGTSPRRSAETPHYRATHGANCQLTGPNRVCAPHGVQVAADRARRCYRLAEPENRLVVRRLEADWEAALAAEVRLREDYDRFTRTRLLSGVKG
jgi:hypothetical protein